MNLIQQGGMFQVKNYPYVFKNKFMNKKEVMNK